MIPTGNPFNIEQNAYFAAYVRLDTRLQAGYEPLPVANSDSERLEVWRKSFA
jgi:hypothetical protein